MGVYACKGLKSNSTSGMVQTLPSTLGWKTSAWLQLCGLHILLLPRHEAERPPALVWTGQSVALLPKEMQTGLLTLPPTPPNPVTKANPEKK